MMGGKNIKYATGDKCTLLKVRVLQTAVLFFCCQKEEKQMKRYDIHLSKKDRQEGNKYRRKSCPIYFTGRHIKDRTELYDERRSVLPPSTGKDGVAEQTPRLREQSRRCVRGRANGNSIQNVENYQLAMFSGLLTL